MKRSMLFWPLVVSAAVCLLWAMLCFVVIGVPVSRGPGSPGFSSPALRLVGAGSRIRLTRCFVSLVNNFWNLAPYCRAPRSDPFWEGHAWGPIGLDIGPNWLPSHWVILSPLPSPLHSSYNGPMLELSPGEVLVYVVLLPGAHLALATFVLVGVITVLTRLLLCVIRTADTRPRTTEEP